MLKLKGKICMLLALIMIAMTIIPIVANAAIITACEVSMTVRMGNTVMNQGNTYSVVGGETINVSSYSASGIAFTGYYFEKNGTGFGYNDIYSNNVSFKVPAGTAGSTISLYVEAVANNDDGTPNTITKTGWIHYYLKYANSVISNKDVTVSAGNTLLSTTSVNTLATGTKLTLKGLPAENIKTLCYCWDKGEYFEIKSSINTITIPTSFEAGSLHKLYVNANYTDGSSLDEWKIYDVRIPGIDNPEYATNLVVKHGGVTISADTRTIAEVGDKVVITATPSANVVKTYYRWDNDDTEDETDGSVTLYVPDFDDGTTHTLNVYVKYDDGSVIGWNKYLFKIDATGEEEEEDDDDDELIIEPWMKENDELSKLAVSLRCDSEDKKYNKNIYALDEEITYYVDYKNGGKDIDDKVTLVLNIPETFKIVDKDGGILSTTKGTLTWTFSSGLEKGESGTKTVVLKYTNIGKSKVTYKIVKPFAEIKKSSKVVDESGIINLIFKETGLEIGNVHYPYMYGDEDTPTFRPNDTITRAEGALVLTRIFGIYTDSVKIVSLYPDLDETYEEAQKAVIVATKSGIIDGYTDGYYRPNEAMTRAEFLKILAMEIEIENEDETGFEIKGEDDSIKLYKNKVRAYYYNSGFITEHWAIDYVTYMARLNMTSVSESDTDLRLDEPITRAEVAQLVNLYLLRAPAKTTSRTASGFTDVYSSHKLFADIIEATRTSHEYEYTEDSREIAK